MITATIKFEDADTGLVIERIVEYSEQSFDLGTFSAIETLVEDVKQKCFSGIEGDLLQLQ